MGKAMLELDTDMLALLEEAAQAQSLSVPEYLGRLVEVTSANQPSSGISYHQKMVQIAQEGQKKYSNTTSTFNREETYDRDYARALVYLENRKRLLERIEATQADMGTQGWNREALYER